MQDFTNFTAAHFVAKFPAVNSSQKPVIGACVWDNVLPVVAQGSKVSTGTTTDLKTDSFAVFECSRSVTTERQSSFRTAFALPISVAISLIIIPSLINTTRMDLNFST